MSKNVMGMIILLAVIGATVFLVVRKDAGPAGAQGGTTLHAFVGGEKSQFLKNPKVLEILADRYDLQIKATKAGSLDMVTTMDTAGKDFLWPSNNVAVDLYGGQYLAQENIFSSPLVIFTWTQVTDALQESGHIEKQGDAFFINDFKSMVESMVNETTWKDFGLTQLYGKMAIFTTDPTRSNSGNMFAGLLTNMLAGGDVSDKASAEANMETLKKYFSRLGHMEHSSGDLFESFLNSGVGGKPMIVGYENQMVEYFIAHQEYQEMLRSQIRQVYPKPTVFASHPVIALTDGGKKFIEAMKDKDIQRIAWEEHGFRSGLIGVQNDPSVLTLTGIPATVDSVMPLPSGDVMQLIVSALR